MPLRSPTPWIASFAALLCAHRCPDHTPLLDCQGAAAGPSASRAPATQRAAPTPRRGMQVRNVGLTLGMQVAADVPIRGPAVRFEHQSLDTTNDRLYISHPGAGELLVMDLETEQIVRTIPGLRGVTGVLAVPELGRVYASTAATHSVSVIDDTTLEIVARVGPIQSPEAIAYAPDQYKIYVSDRAGGGELVIDAVSNTLLARVPMSGGAGNTVYDPGSHCMIVADESNDQLVAIDPRTDRLLGRYGPPGSARPHGLAIDPSRRLLFVANRRGATLSVIDLTTLKVRATLPIGADPDVLAFDPGWDRLYVASESGIVSIFTDMDGDLAFEGAVAMRHAHTVAVDPRTHLAYFPLQNVAGRPLVRIMSGTPPFVPGQFRPADRDEHPALTLNTPHIAPSPVF